MHWWPRHTPSTGTPRSPKARIASFERPASSGAARAGRDRGPRRARARCSSSSVDRVVAVHDRLGAELTQVLHEVVDERVVVVDHEHRARRARYRSRAGAARDRLSPRRGATRKSPPPSTRRPRSGSRYTPPAPKKVPPSHALGAGDDVHLPRRSGVVVIVRNYLELLPGGEASNRYLLLGLVLLISGGFVLSTFFR